MTIQLAPLTLYRRVTLFVVGLLECAIFGGMVFGWPQLVLVLKQEGIYADLCSNNTMHLDHYHQHVLNDTSSFVSLHQSNSNYGDFDDNYKYIPRQTTNSPSTFTDNFSQTQRWQQWKTDQCGNTTQESGSYQNKLQESAISCPAQDTKMALVFTASVVSYSLPSVLVGYMLHYAGLWVTRFLASLMITCSFVLLGLVSPESPSYLFPAMILLAVGSNQLRLSAVQLGDLFPRWRSTAITIIMGAYSASSSVFYIFQVTADAGVPRAVVCWVLASISGLSFLATFLMPVKHVSQHMSPETPVAPLSTSLWSWSSLLHQYFYTVTLFALNSFQQLFNYWVTISSCTTAEVQRFTVFYSFCGIVGAIVSADIYFTRTTTPHANVVDCQVQEIQNHFTPLLVTSMCAIFMYANLMGFNAISIYMSFFGLMACRSRIISTTTAFLRSRFPVEHLNRLIGIYSTITSLLLLLIYPHFVWSMNHYYTLSIVTLVFVIFSLAYPLHLLYGEGIRKSLLLHSDTDGDGSVTGPVLLSANTSEHLTNRELVPLTDLTEKTKLK